MKIYLAARYSRHPEMREVRDWLEQRGHKVTSRWIDCHGDSERFANSFETHDQIVLRHARAMKRNCRYHCADSGGLYRRDLDVVVLMPKPDSPYADLTPEQERQLTEGVPDHLYSERCPRTCCGGSEES